MPSWGCSRWADQRDRGLAVGIARNRASGPVPAARAALVLGLGLVLPLTLVTAGTLAQNGGHWVGGTPDDASAWR